MVEEICRLRSERRWEEALEAVRRLPIHSTQLALEEADLLARMREPGQALKVLEPYRDELPPYGRALLAGLLEHEGRGEEANALFHQLESEPQLPLPVARRVARNLISRGFPERALQLAERIARPTPPELVWLARCYLAAGHPEEARHTLERALRRSPEHVPALEEWGRLCPFPARLPEVLLGHSPAVVTRALERLARFWRQDAQPVPAREALEECCRREPGSAYYLANLGYVHRELGDLESALACLERALAADPDDPITFTAYLATCREAKQRKRAASYILGRVKGDPGARHLWGRYRKFFGRAGGGARTGENRPQ